ncbi:AlpA family transcriptional regulator [Lentimicrobium sp. S6]|uniref:helix-turn-helix transcriptional regulator n=1 Tax=Lentimicrobium sp. S6 TaxID=2735872 RepID=UPI001557CC19|nr:helix-turn-helix domain-containing protein [Lentimicrobium sp. S6]NPD47614.1 helix-turn-helix domain-containing protein [Lentimicrobium sp. S6]
MEKDFFSEFLNSLKPFIKGWMKEVISEDRPKVSANDSQQDRWFNLDGIVEYDPVNRTKPTWYSMVSRGQVPFHKTSGRLMFLKSEIDSWLKSGKHKTKSEIKAEVHTYLVNKKRKGNYEK